MKRKFCKIFYSYLSKFKLFTFLTNNVLINGWRQTYSSFIIDILLVPQANSNINDFHQLNKWKSTNFLLIYLSNSAYLPLILVGFFVFFFVCFSRTFSGAFFFNFLSSKYTAQCYSEDSSFSLNFRAGKCSKPI